MDDKPEDRRDAARKLILKAPEPAFGIGTGALGPLSFEGDLRYKDLLELVKLDGNDQFTPEAFASELIRLLGARGPADDDAATPLSADDVRSLSVEERRQIVAKLLESLKLHTTSEITFEKDADGFSRAVEGPDTIVVSRDEGETDEVYLLRSWRDYRRRFTARTAAISQHLKGAFGGFSKSFQGLVVPDLAANFAASQRLADQLARIGSGMDFSKVLYPTGRTWSAADPKPKKESRPHIEISSLVPSSPVFDLPPSPFVKTNELLASMESNIAGMAALTANTAEMQRSLNDAARNILTLFAKGAEDSRRAGNRALLISIITALLTLAAVAAGVWGVLYQDGASGRREAVADTAHAAEMKALGDDAMAINRLASAIEMQRKPASLSPGSPNHGHRHVGRRR